MKSSCQKKKKREEKGQTQLKLIIVKERIINNGYDIFMIYNKYKFYSRHILYEWVMWHYLTYIIQMLRNGMVLKAKSSSLFHFLVLRVFDKVFKRKNIVQSYSSNSSLNHSKVYESLPRHNMMLPSFVSSYIYQAYVELRQG